MSSTEAQASTPKATRLEPPMSPAGEPFWQATREPRLDLPWCTSCERAIWYPRLTCPDCLGSDLEWRPASGEGTVYAASVQHRPAHPKLADRVPYVVALVDLAEGVRMMSSVVDTDPESVSPGLAVTVAWEPLSDGRHLPVFAPRAGS
jgi:uncharacterized OB-fold protein